MGLHTAKKSAIIHWFNTLDIKNLTSIAELSDGTYFCEIITSVFNISYCPSENASKDLCCNVDASPNKIDSVEESLNISVEKSSQNLFPRLRKHTRSASDVQSSVTNKQVDSFAHDDKKSASEKCGNEEIKEISSSTKTFESFHTDQDKERRFKFIESFIDSVLIVETKNFISYKDCLCSNELELAKVAIFLLTAIVKKFLKTGSDKLNTLTLLNLETQEDIQDCLSLFLPDICKVNEKDIRIVLTRPARCRVSPRVKSRYCTPERTRSSRNLSMTSTNEEIYSDSPLKSFLSSPQILKENVIQSQERQILKMQNVIYELESKRDDMDEKNEYFKKKLDEKDKEIKTLKARIRSLDESKVVECEEKNAKIQKLNEQISSLKASFAAEIEESERKCRYLVHQNEELEEKIKGPYKKYPTGQLEDFPVILKQKDELLNMERERNKHLETSLEEMKVNSEKTLESTIKEMNANFEKVKQIYEHKLSERTVPKDPESPVMGECLGNILEEENSVLHAELDKKNLEINSLAKKLESASVELEFYKNELNNKKENQFVDVSCNTSINLAEVANEVKKQCEMRKSELEKESVELTNAEGVSNRKGETVNQTIESSLNSNIASAPQSACGSSSDLGILWARFTEPRSVDKSSLGEGLSENDLSEMCDKVPEVSECDIADKRDILGSLWNNYIEEVPESDKIVKHPNNFDVSQTVECNINELSSKWIRVFEFLNYLKELRTVRLSGGLSKSDICEHLSEMKLLEDFILCLIYIREFLCSILNNNENKVLNNRAFDSDTYAVCTVLQKHKELLSEVSTLTADMNRNESEYRMKLDEKDSEIQNLVKEKNSLLEKCEKLKILNEEMKKSVIELTEKHMLLTQEKQALMNKCVFFKQQHDMICKKLERLRNFSHIKIRELMVVRELNENQLKKLREDLIATSAENRNVMSEYEILTKRHSHLRSSFKKALMEMSNLKMDLDKARNEQSLQQQRENNIEIVLKVNDARKESVNALPDATSGPLVSSKKDFSSSCQPQFQDVSSLDVGNESTSSAFFNKSIHNGLILLNEDEESFVSHSSIHEIKRDQPLNSKKKRLLEIQRRNTLCLPHLQSAYPTELQAYSPCDSSMFNLLKENRKKLESDEGGGVDIPNNNSSVHDNVVKKRKMSDLTSEKSNEEEPATLFTPVQSKKKRKMKTPTSLHKLLYFHRNKSTVKHTTNKF